MRPVEIVIYVCAFLGVAVLLRMFYVYQRDRPARRHVQRIMAARRREQREKLTAEEKSGARYELFQSKFHFQDVLPDKSNITATSIRSAATDAPDEERPNKRSKTPLDECCICLDCYREGETICAPMTTDCSHVFHEACIVEWLKTKDRCPMCRVELLK